MTWTLADTESSIPEAFARQVRLRPEAPATAGIEWTPSFAELDAAANLVASSILDRAGPGDGRVALLVSHDAPVLAAALAVLKAGKAAVVLNPTDPPARLGHIREDVEPELVVADPRHLDRALAAGFRQAECISLPALAETGGERDPAIDSDPDALAFVVYTSGTTGRPKGVMHSHRSILHNVLRQTNGLGIGPEDRLALPASLSGAQGLASSWVGLLNGGTVCPFPIAERGAIGMTAWLAEREITVFVASASVFRGCAQVLGDARLPAIRLLRLGSEAVRWDDVEIGRRHCSPDVVVANMYSSSEAGNVTQRLFGPDATPPPGRLPAGRAAEGMEVRIVNERGDAVPTEAIGEVTVRSAFLSLGYWRREELTAASFTAPADDTATRVLSTGDLGYVGEDGALTLTGSRDRAVQVHGYRVEPSEVEAALVAHPDVGSAAVVAAEGAREEATLIAYVAGPERSAADLRAHLRERLPEHAVPGRFAFVDELPLTSGGAVDRSRLLAAELPQSGEPASGAGESTTERLVADAWSEVLQVDRVGPDSEFYELGGDSLSAAIVAAKIHGATGVELELGSFIEAPTVPAMATLVERLRAVGPDGRRPALVPAPREEPLPASFRQEFAWRQSRALGDSRFFTMAAAVRLEGSLDVAALRMAIDHIVRRHEVLRTSFAERAGTVVQIVHPFAPVELPLHDLSGAAEPAAEADALLAAEADAGFDLVRGPLLRLRLVRLAPREHRLLRVNHHVISDAQSWRVFYEELAELYESYLRGLPPALPDELPLQYGDYAAWERTWLVPGAPDFGAELAWWLRRFADAPEPPRLPFVRSAPAAGIPPSDGVIETELAPDVASSLDRLARAERTSPFTVRQALLAAQLAVETDRDEVVLASFVRNRRELAVQRMFGWFANAITLRLRVDPAATFRGCLRAVRDEVSEASARAAIESERLSTELASEGVRVPPTQAFVAERSLSAPLRFAGLELVPLPPALDGMPLGFTVAVEPGRAGRASVRFDANVFDPALVQAFVERSERFAGAVAAEPDRPWGSVARSLTRESRVRRWLRL